jgi:putative N6-adenine-specific DNA methylase
LLLAEIAALGASGHGAHVVEGGVELEGDDGLLYRCHLELGLALKVLVRLGSFPARRFDMLVKRTAALPWEVWCTRGLALDVRVTCKRSRLYHSSAVAERVLLAIGERLGAPVVAPAKDSDEPRLAVHARIVDDLCTISVDASGELLHRRGYKQSIVKAPLREDLARALLLASGWDCASPLYDPFAGSGTIAIEADWLSRGVPPGALRRFAFMDAPCFDAATFARLRKEALSRVRTEGPPIRGSDRDQGAVQAARENAERAQAHDVSFCHAALSNAEFFAKGVDRGAVVTNPPYGRRVGRDATLDNLYRALGDRMRSLPGTFQIAMAVAAPERAWATGLRLEPALMTDHGGSKIYFARGVVTNE